MYYSTRSILAVDVSGFGTSLRLIPAMRAVRKALPNSFIVAATHVGTCEALDAQGVTDATISLGVIKLPSSGPGAFKRGWTLARRVKDYSFDLVLDFSPRLETQAVTRLALNARVLTPSRLPRFFNKVFAPNRPPRSDNPTVLADYASVLRQIGVEIKDPRFAILIGPEQDRMFEKRLYDRGYRGGELLVLLFASNPDGNRGWPIPAFGELGTRLSNNFNARIVAADEPSDNSLTRSVMNQLPAGAVRLSEPGVLELFAALARSSVVVTDDSAIAQAASELGTPAIEIADSQSIGQESKNHRTIRSSSRMRISVDEVFEAASEVIQENRSPSLFHRS